MTPPTFPFRIPAAGLVLLLAIIFPVYSDDPHSIVLKPIKPPPTQCESFTFRWTGGTPPFFVNLLQQGLPQQELQGQRHLGPTNDSSFPWDSDFPAGTVLQATVSGTDSASEQPVTITMQLGPTIDCLGLRPPSSPTSSSESSGATRSTDSTVPSTSPTTPVPDPSSSSTRSTSAERTPSPPSSMETGTSTLSPTDSQTSSLGSSYTSMPLPQSSSDGPSGATTSSSPESQPSLTLVTASQETNSGNPTMSMFAPPASIAPLQHALSGSSKSGRVAGIVIGCLVLAALLATLALVLLRRYRRARERARIASVSTLDTLAFTATTWSDLSPPEPDKPLGAKKGVTEWNADLFASPRKPQSTRSSPSPSPSSWVPFIIPHAPFRRPGATARATSLSTIPEAPTTTSTTASVPSPVDSGDSASTAPSLRSYPPLVPQTMTLPASAGRGGGYPPAGAGQHAYPPALLPPAQVPVNPFRARLLAAASGNGNGGGGGNGRAWAGRDGYGAAREDPFR